jgi:hypothetical protein
VPLALLLAACHGADPDWDLYPLESFALSDLPRPKVISALVGQGADRALTVTFDADLRCPIPLANAVHASVEGVPLVAVPGDVRGNGVGKSCRNASFRIPVADLPRDLPAWTLALDDGTTHWEIRLARPDAPRTLTTEPSVSAGDQLQFRVAPAEDRWVADPPGARPSTVQLTAQTTDPTLTCTTEFEVALPAAPADVLALDVPDDFCPGPAALGLSSSSRRSAVLACPDGVVCRLETGGFVARVQITP